MEKPEITVCKHEFLDCSVGWFVKINGVKSGGEIHSQGEAINIAKQLAVSLNGIFNPNIQNTNELFS